VSAGDSEDLWVIRIRLGETVLLYFLSATVGQVIRGILACSGRVKGCGTYLLFSLTSDTYLCTR
jgi:hypothetical protein